MKIIFLQNFERVDSSLAMVAVEKSDAILIVNLLFVICPHFLEAFRITVLSLSV